MTPRQGLKRDGFLTYLIEGPRGAYAIDRSGPRRFFLRPAHFPRNLMAEKYRRLTDARREAEAWVGLPQYEPVKRRSRPFDLVLDLPPFLRRSGVAG